jgi:dihydromethanopterin reductase (acceptor)
MGGLVNDIAWAITGAGHHLSGIFKAMRDLRASGVRITVFLSAAAQEVVRMYGLEAVLREVAPGAYYEEVLTDEGEGASKPTAARLARGAYKALVVAPATANTVAKVVHGIADNLVTNAVAHAQKGGEFRS